MYCLEAWLGFIMEFFFSSLGVLFTNLYVCLFFFLSSGFLSKPIVYKEQ